MKKIIVNSKTFGTHTILVSDADYAELSKFTWSVYKGRSTFYAVTRLSKYKTIAIHRMVTKAKTGEMVDHKDHNGLNNMRSNLRRCTASENSKNMLMHKNNPFGYKGVGFDKRRDFYYSRIRVDKTNKFLGYFMTPIDAAKAYNSAAIKHYGEFAKLNKL